MKWVRWVLQRFPRDDPSAAIPPFPSTPSASLAPPLLQCPSRGLPPPSTPPTGAPPSLRRPHLSSAGGGRSQLRFRPGVAPQQPLSRLSHSARRRFPQPEPERVHSQLRPPPPSPLSDSPSTPPPSRKCGTSQDHHHWCGALPSPGLLTLSSAC